MRYKEHSRHTSNDEEQHKILYWEQLDQWIFFIAGHPALGTAENVLISEVSSFEG